MRGEGYLAVGSVGVTEVTGEGCDEDRVCGVVEEQCGAVQCGGGGGGGDGGGPWSSCIP